MPGMIRPEPRTRPRRCKSPCTPASLVPLQSQIRRRYWKDGTTSQTSWTRRFAPTHSAVPVEVTTEDHVAYWSKNPENKGSEPNGLHNGHFKAGIQSEMIATCDAMIRNIPIISGFVPDLWKNLMNFAIEKKPGDFRVERMRTIQLMNAEFQANN